MHLLAAFEPLVQTEMTNFPNLSYNKTNEIPTLPLPYADACISDCREYTRWGGGGGGSGNPGSKFWPGGGGGGVINGKPRI